MACECKNTLTVSGGEWQNFVNENTGKKGGIDFNLGYPLKDYTRMQKYRVWGSILAMSGQGEWRGNKLVFYTMNFPPEAYFLHISKKYPGLSFHLGHEEWVNDNYGLITIKDGVTKINSDIDDYFAEIYGFEEPKDALLAIENEYTLEFPLCDINLLRMGGDETEITRYMRHLGSIDWEKAWETYVENHLEK